MDIRSLIQYQRDFDMERRTRFSWAQPITPEDYSGLLHGTLGLVGEAGEVANLVKKFDRGDFSFEELLDQLQGELADVLIYLFKLSYQSGIDLEQAFLDKLSLNRLRFPENSEGGASSPPVPPARAWTSLRAGGSMESLGDWAAYAAYVARPRDLAEIEMLYADARVRVGQTHEATFGGALLALVLADAGKFEGHPADRDRVWERLESFSIRYGYSRSDVSALTRSEPGFRSLLDRLLRHAPEGDGSD